MCAGTTIAFGLKGTGRGGVSLTLKGCGHQASRPQEDDVSRRQVARVCSILDQHLPFSSLGIQNGNTGLIVPGFPRYREQHTHAAGETMR